MNAEQKRMARHALGLPNNTRRSYRNHYVIGPGAPDHAEWSGLVSKGMAEMSEGKPRETGHRMDCFFLTRAGAEAALEGKEKLCPEDFPPPSEKAA